MEQTKKIQIPEFRLTHISPTSVQMFRRCEWQFYCRYILGIKKPPGATLTFGKAFDEGVSKNYEYKIKHGVDMPVNDVKDIFATSFDKLAPETEWKEDEKPAEIKDEGVVGVEVFHQDVFPKVRPAQVQLKLSIGFNNTPVSADGVIDTVETNGTISDTKTGSKAWSPGEEYREIQPPFYSLLMDRDSDNTRIFRFDRLIRYKKKRPVVQPVPLEIGPLQRHGLMLLLATVIAKMQEAIKTGTFMPRDDHRLCSKKYCGYADLCEKTWKWRIKD